tara:strand:- start:7176 stop:7457 length:282 start_codon:yes stop_codon:yes gene_type:complete
MTVAIIVTLALVSVAARAMWPKSASIDQSMRGGAGMYSVIPTGSKRKQPIFGIVPLPVKEEGYPRNDLPTEATMKAVLAKHREITLNCQLGKG